MVTDAFSFFWEKECIYPNFFNESIVSGEEFVD